MPNLRSTHLFICSRLREESGIALVLALAITAALTVSATAAVTFTASSARSSDRSKADQTALALAEAGLSNATAVLGNPSNNALQAATLPSSEATASSVQYEAGTAKWWGSLNPATQTWSLVGKGIVRSADPNAASVTRTVGESIDVLANLTQPLNNQAWNYLMARRTGDPDHCDQELRQSVTVRAPLYVSGNLCMFNTASVMPGVGPPSPAPAVNLVVAGSASFANTSHVGESDSKIASAYIANGCNGHVPCSFNSADPVWATASGQVPPAITAPTVDWDYWYANASPGPRHPCAVTAGTPPILDNNAFRDSPNGSVPVFDLTPVDADYTCRNVSGGGAVIGELSWNHTTKVLTVRGAIFIDGSVLVSQGPVNYNGQASLYLSGTFTMGTTTQLCGGVVAGHCDFGAWNPNTELLLVIANGDDGSRVSAALNQSSDFQGGIYATNDVVIGQSANLEGPLLGGSLILNNTVDAKPFPVIDTVPIGTPGNPNVYAQPQQPRNFSG